MRNLISKMMTGTMIAGAALLVSACGGTDDAAVNTTNMTEMDASDTMMDGTNDVTAVDAGTGMDANMSMDMNAMDANMSNGAMDANMSGNMTNGM